MVASYINWELIKKGSENCSLTLSHKTDIFTCKIKRKAKPWAAWFNQYQQDIKSHWYYICAHACTHTSTHTHTTQINKNKYSVKEDRQITQQAWGGGKKSSVFHLFCCIQNPLIHNKFRLICSDVVQLYLWLWVKSQ